MTETEYNQCVHQYADNVFRFVVKNLRHEEDARDVVQTAFEKLWRNRLEVDNEKSKSYLFTIAYHQLIDHVRKMKKTRLQEEVKENSAFAPVQQSSNLKEILMQALGTLNETQKS
jgi:RNA polymerase sigma factor (sigma-70 family)